MFKLAGPLNVALKLLIPTYSSSYGVQKKTFPTMENGLDFNGSFRTFGGTEKTIDGLLSVENTAVVETWYRPDIASNCRIGVPETGKVFEILGEPENIGMRNQYLRIKLIEVKGGA